MKTAQNYRNNQLKSSFNNFLGLSMLIFLQIFLLGGVVSENSFRRHDCEAGTFFDKETD
jgi:hypothetical protein